MTAQQVATRSIMPIDNKPRTTTSKPITPALSSNFRARSTVTPRITGSAPTSPAVGVARSLRSQTISPERDDEKVTPLYGNITPRTGVRSSRIADDSPSTPLASRVLRTTYNKSSPQLTGLGLGYSQQITNGLSANGTRTSGGSNGSQPRNMAKFFHADEVQTTSSSANPVGRNVGLKSPQTPRSQPASPKASPKKSQSNNADGRFFRADEALRPMRPTPTSKASSTSNIHSASPSMVTSGTNRNVPPPSPPQRSPASKFTQSNSPIWGRIRSASNSSQKPTVTNQTQIQSIAERRRSSSLQSISTSPKGHRKTASTTTLVIPTFATVNQTDTYPSQSKILQMIRPMTEPAPVSPSGTRTISDTTSPRSTSMTSGETVRTSVTSETERSDFSKAEPVRPPFRHMRTGSELSQMSPINQSQLEAAANARRERKVLDLEISNSSLLAINKTLERELRKQNNELRRFRRLSRSGRLSIMPSDRSMSGQSVSTMKTLEEVDDEDDDLRSDGDDSQDEYMDEDDDILSEGQSSLLGSMDRAKRRAKDEKRLMLDLSKHQKILIDSQKLSQSIQRCLNCTDELIKDANKALAYRVGIGDIKLGGRVLSHDDDDDHRINTNASVVGRSNSVQGLLSPSISKAELTEAGLFMSNFSGLGNLPGTQGSDAMQLHDQTYLPYKLTYTDSPSLMESPTLMPEQRIEPTIVSQVDINDVMMS